MDNDNGLVASEKQLITTELLGLRAGLSVISKYTDEIRQEEEKIEEQEELFKANCYNEEQKLKELENHLRERKDRQYYLERNKSHNEEVLKNPLKDEKIYFFPDWCYDEAWWLFTFFFTACTYFLLPLLWYLIKRYRRKKEIVERSNKWLLEINQELSEISKEIEDLEKQYEQAQLERDKNINTFEMQKQEATASCQQNIHALAEQAREVNTALQQTYGVFLSKSDWGNIDLIIHYVETGRADTLKEALYQVDRQRQNDRLVEAIQSAAKQIGTHIDSAFRRLGGALAQCFDRLDAHIQGISIQLAESRQATLSANTVLLDRLDTQISATQQQNALLEKSNASSDELIHDLRYNQKYWLK